MKVILIEDQKLLSSVLIHAWEQDDEIEIVGHSDKASDALMMCETYRPDLVIMDIFTKDGNGIDITHILKQHYPAIKIVIMTGMEDEHLVKGAEAAGADVFVRKDVSLDELREFIRYASKSYRVFPKISLELHDAVNFSTVDLHIIRLLAQGKGSREIAAELFISYGTVRQYISRMYNATGLRSRAQLVSYAMQNGLLKPD